MLQAAPRDEAVDRDIPEDVRRWLAARGIPQWTMPFGESWIAEKIAAGEVFASRPDGKPVGAVSVRGESMTLVEQAITTEGWA